MAGHPLLVPGLMLLGAGALVYLARQGRAAQAPAKPLPILTPPPPQTAPSSTPATQSPACADLLNQASALILGNLGGTIPKNKATALAAQMDACPELGIQAADLRQRAGLPPKAAFAVFSGYKYGRHTSGRY